MDEYNEMQISAVPDQFWLKEQELETSPVYLQTQSKDFSSKLLASTDH